MLQRSPSSRTEFVELLHDRSTVLRRLERLASSAVQVRCVLSGRGRLGRHDTALLDVMAGASERQLLIDPQLVGCAETVEHATRLRLDVRVHPGSARHMLVFDDRYAALPLDPSDLSAGVVVLRGPLATPYDQLFELMWSDAYAPGEEGARPDSLSPRQLKVVELLLDGATDHQVAARLGMSSRTVRAVVAQLQERFGTRSRMALGFQLARVDH